MTQSVRAVDRALDILLCFTREEPTRSLTQIAESVQMSKTTVHRLLTTLENKRFINRDKVTGMYRLGFRLIEMASLVLQDVELPRWAQPYLKSLATQYGETVDLSVLDGAHVMYLEVIESPQRVKLAAAVGQRLPAYFTASGKALLAFTPEDQVTKILAENLSEHDGDAELTIAEALEDLRRTAKRGYAISEQEYEDHINAVAAPIFDADRHAIASIAIVGPSFRLSKERLPELGESICRVSETIAQEVGFTALSAIVARIRS
ncbi:MAG: IclR family transcriptional regulator [Acidobacteriota bacterium]|nr:IclR family transcriptional regulator [Acidobacteriota bacterium]